jgi:two-component system OmpR family response regulator
MPARPSHSVLVVENEHAIRTVLGAALRPEGFDVRLAEGGAEGVALYRARPADLVLLDVWMPGLDGPGTLAALRGLDPDVRCCFMTGHADPWSAARLLALGALHVLLKPFRLDELMVTVRRLLGVGAAAAT